MQFKKSIYIFLSILLGAMVSYIVHASLEIWYINTLESSGQAITWYQHFGAGSCALPPAVQYGLLIVGLVGGFIVGHMWWRIVYIEKRHWRTKKKNLSDESGDLNAGH